MTTASGRSASTGGGGIEVYHLPDYTDVNPYQRRLAEALDAEGVSVTVLGGRGRGLPVLRAILHEGLPDVVHLHFVHQFGIDSDSPPAWIGWPVSLVLTTRFLLQLAVLKLLGVGLVWTVHDLLNHERTATSVEVACKHLLVRFLLDEVLVHCPAAAAEIAEAYRLPDRLLEDVRVVPHGNFRGEYPDEIDRRTARERLDVPADATVFGFFGSVRPYKNVDLLVETFGRLDGDDLRLLVAGPPGTAAYGRTVADLAADDDRVHTAFEYVPTEEVQLYMRAADAIVVPFRTAERSVLTSGSVVLAMGFGRAVVAPDVGCVGHAIEDAGIAYDPGDGAPEVEAEALHGAMRTALEADLAAMGRRAHRRTDRLTWDDVAVRTVDAYTAAVDRGTARRAVPSVE
jgi:glycosyltransferase involved in cell wall biosynthesis